MQKNSQRLKGQRPPLAIKPRQRAPFAVQGAPAFLSLSGMRAIKKFLYGSPPSSAPAMAVSASAPTVSWPQEFLCPLSSLPMSDPVFLSSGQSYERNCISAWIQSGMSHCYVTGKPLSATDDPPSLVSNLSLISAIQRFCNSSGLDFPSPPSIDDSRLIVAKHQPPTTPTIQPRICHSATGFGSSSSTGPFPPFPLPLASLPVPREEPETDLGPDPPESGGAKPVPPPSLLVQRLRSPRFDEQAAALLELRELTRSEPDRRLSIAAESAVLSALFDLATSTDSRIQSDAIATIVNLSLQKENKVLLVRRGALPFLIDAIRTGGAEARAHAIAGIFSLAVEEDNRVVIVVAGAIPLLLRLLSSEGDGDRGAGEDAAMALYFISLERGNRWKMIRDGAIPILLRRARVSPESGDARDVLRARCFMILCNLAMVEEGRRALRGFEAITAATEEIERATGSGPTVEHALALMLVILGKGNGRFLAVEISPGVVRSLLRLAQHGKGRAKEKANALLMVVKEAQAVEIDGDGGDSSAMPQMTNFAAGDRLSGPRTTGF